MRRLRRFCRANALLTGLEGAPFPCCAPVDMVNVFRRTRDIPPHLPDILAARPRVVWMQLGIRNDEVAEALARAGIKVVQDHCLMVDHRQLAR